MEEWKDIKDFEGKYQISTEGEVKSLNYNNTGKEKILTPKINKQGHLEVTLNKHDKHYYKLLSRLVFENLTGIQLTRNDIIMYKDKDKTNCSLANLYIISRGNRQEITYDNDRRYRLEYEYYGNVLTTKQIAKITGIDSKTIRRRITSYWNIYEASEIPVAIYKKGR